LIKDQFGNEDQTRFRVTGRLNDGYVVWRGWFDDRDDLDAFLWALAKGTLKSERALWSLCSPEWSSDIGENLSYEFATVTFLSSSPGSNQTYTSPSDWNNNNNTIECIGGGGSGAVGSLADGFRAAGTGAGAGAYSKISNFTFASPGTTTATYNVGKFGAAVSSTVAGNAGTSTWFNSSTDPGVGTDNSKCSARFGTGGIYNTGGTQSSAGGATSSSWGQTKYNGGDGGQTTSGASAYRASGGGGAAGPSGAGLAGGNATAGTPTAGNGGNANNGAGATGGAGSTSAAGGIGGSGTEWDGTHGVGAGGGAYANSATSFNAGSAGNYGGAGAGCSSSSVSGHSSGAGAQGLIVITYTPQSLSSNMPMLGM